MEYRGVPISKDRFPALYEYELRGGPITIDGKGFSKVHLNEIVEEVKVLTGIYNSRCTDFGCSENIHIIV